MGKAKRSGILGGQQMTDRFHSLTVVLEGNIREDDAESLINAILHLRRD